MCNNNTNKFVITKGMDNEFIITIKQNGTTLPMEIQGTDTFEAKLVNISDGAEVATLTTNVINAQNGKIKLVLSESQVDGLNMERGDRADYFYSKPLYRLIIDCETINNGKFLAKVQKVYVE